MYPGTLRDLTGFKMDNNSWENTPACEAPASVVVTAPTLTRAYYRLI